MPTWRHTLYGQCVILLFAGVAYGQYDTNAWPAYLHPRAGKTHAENCYSGLLERADSYWTAGFSDRTSSAPTWYRSQKGNIEKQKALFKNYVASFGYWIIPTNTMPVILAKLNAKTNAPLDDTVYSLATTTAVAWLEYCKMPTNFLDYTPYRGLDGVGPFTNDTTVGHPHGWTNAYTLAGGTNYPAGRTNWYTTDYGWDGLKHLTTNLIVRVGLPDGLVARNWSVTGWYWPGGTSPDTDWSVVESAFLSYNVQTNNSQLWYSIRKTDTRAEQPPEESQKDMAGYSAKVLGAFDIAASSRVPAVYPIFLTGTATYPQYAKTNYNVYTTPITYPYSSFGLGYDNIGAFYTTDTLTNGGYYGWQLGDSTQSNKSISVFAGSTNVPTLAGYPDAPGLQGVSQIADGFTFGSFYNTIWNFDNGTNGFKYK